MSVDIMGDADILGALAMGDDLLGATLLGRTDIMGDEDILGAARGGQRYNPQVAQLLARMQAIQSRGNAIAQLARAKQAGGVAVVQKEPSESRVQLLPFDSVTNVLATTTQTITQQPQQEFRGRRFVVGDGIASSFLINDIKVGKDSQMLASGSGPASAFKPDAVAIDLKFDTCQPGCSVAVSVTNFTLADARFVAYLIGDTVQ